MHRPISTLMFWILGMTASLQAQLTIHVSAVPSNTPSGDTIFIAGNFNDWNPGLTSYALTPEGNGAYAITISPAPGTLEYKFTRGSWSTVEGNANGGYIPNRTYSYPGGVQNTTVTIAGWEDRPGEVHTTEDNVSILDEDFYIPQLQRTRRIWLYLPPDYATSSKRYPVIYMQDGQNLFDVITSFAGEWKVDESMNDLFDEGDYGAIVVGIDNGGSERIDEYSPWINPDYGGGHGEAYADFLVHTLKPHIDSLYRTLPDRQYTAIAGSSLGANISMYTAIEYKEIFGKAAIFSPAFWFSDSAYVHLAQKGITQDLRVYFVAGQNESASMIPAMMAMYDGLIAAGQDETEMYFLSQPDGAHSEWFWAREYPAAYTWLFSETLLHDHNVPVDYINVFPNPAHDCITIRNAPQASVYSIRDTTGKGIEQGAWSSDLCLPIGQLLPGVYVVQLLDADNKVIGVTRFVKQ